MTQPMRSTSATAPMRTRRAGRTAPHEVGVEREHVDAPARVAFRELLFELGADPRHLRVGLLHGDPGAEARDRHASTGRTPSSIPRSRARGSTRRLREARPAPPASRPRSSAERPSSMTSRPRIEASPPNRLFQRRGTRRRREARRGARPARRWRGRRWPSCPSTSKKSAVTTAPLRRTGSLPVVRLTSRGPKPARPEKTRLRSRQWTKFAGLTELRSRFRLTLRSQTNTSRSGSWKGRGRRSTASTMLNRAALAPMPRARVATATAVKPGRRTRSRTPSFRSWRRSFIPASLSSIFRKGHATAPPRRRSDTSSIWAPSRRI